MIINSSAVLAILFGETVSLTRWAKVENQPLLFKGDAFTRTDAEAA